MKKIIFFIIFSCVFLNAVYAADVEIQSVSTSPAYLHGCKGGTIVFDVVVAAGVIVDYVQVQNASGNNVYISGALPFYLFESKSYHFPVYDLYAGTYTIVVKETVIGDKKYYYNYPRVDDGPSFNFTITGTSPTGALCSNGNIRIVPNNYNLSTIDVKVKRNDTNYTSFSKGLGEGPFDVAVPSGHYSVVVTYNGYNNSCTDSVTHEIDIAAPPCTFDFSIIHTVPIKNCSNASITLFGNSPPCLSSYSVNIFRNGDLVYTNPSFTTSALYIPNMQSGHYKINMNANAGYVSCSATHEFDIDTAGPQFFTPTITSSNITTNGCSNGKINIALPNSNSNYFTNFWADPWQSRYTAYLYNNIWSLITSVQGYDTIHFDHQPPGTYNLLIIGQRFDAQTCPVPYVQPGITLTEQPCMLNLTATAAAPAYLGCNDGSVTVNMENFSNDCSPHIVLYDFNNEQVDEWFPSSGALPFTFNNLVAGNYHIIADAGNCSATANIMVSDGPCDIRFALTVNNGLHGCNNSSISLNNLGNICGVVNFTYQNNDAPFDTGVFTGGDSLDFMTPATLYPGNYTVTGTSGSCTASKNIIVSDPPCTLAATATSAYHGTCSGYISGYINNFCTSAHVELRQSAGNALIKSVFTTSGYYIFDTLDNGSYNVVVTDNSGCSISIPAGISGLICTAPAGGHYVPVAAQKGNVVWNIVSCAIGYTIQYRVQGTAGWASSNVTTNTGSKTLTGLQKNTAYECRIKTKCTPTFTSLYSAIFTFNTGATLRSSNISASVKVKNQDDVLKVYPNPSKGIAYLIFSSKKSADYSIIITDLTGKTLIQKKLYAIKGQNKIAMDVSQYSNGIYLVTVKDNKQVSRSIKLIKQ